MLRLMRSTAVWSNAVAVAIVAASATVAGAQTMGTAKRPGANLPISSVGAAFGKCSTADKVMVTNLTLSPAAPKLGDKVTVTLTARNLCDVVLGVPWEISGPSSVLGSGTQQNVPAGGNFVVSAVWTATAGAGGALGAVDPRNNFNETVANRTNNNKQVHVSVETPVTLVSSVLNYQKAKNAGANFAQNIDPNPFGCGWLGQFDGAPLGSSVAFRIDCAGTASASPEAFSNFTLKNNWKIKEVGDPVFRINGSGHGADYQWVGQPPQVGSNNPRMQMRLTAQNAGSSLTPATWFSIRVIIEGPDGTCPYKVMSGPCP